MWLSTKDYEYNLHQRDLLIVIDKMLSELNSKTNFTGNGKLLGDDNSRGCSSVDRARAFQVRSRRFEPCHPLQGLRESFKGINNLSLSSGNRLVGMAPPYQGGIGLVRDQLTAL